MKHAEIRRQRGNNEEGIAFEIRTKLQPLAIGQKLSPKVDKSKHSFHALASILNIPIALVMSIL
ncbi:hypothetical protein [Lacticaseibacillus rhamnosus]|uniref:hypothetical protein n=1 Tax=Lacticaseibacillus rhamnosus TaxID=47715 RepID=UPI0016674013|nr:hypothetical protein [Lacticaseibacillus rhamnosus]